MRRLYARFGPQVLGVAFAAFMVLILLATRYGPHRDEMYFVVAGRHPAWGYPDQPPLTPLLATALDSLNHSLIDLRFVSALIVAAVVLISADLVRVLGGSRTAQLLTAVIMATGPGVLAIGHLLSTATLDLFFWVLLVRLVVHVVQNDRPRLWLVIGLVLGISLENKNLPATLAAGLLIGLLLTPGARHHLRSPWLWLAAVIALVCWAPNLIWQAQHGWPQLTLAQDIRAETRTPGGIVQLIFFQLLLLGPVGGVLTVIGLIAVLRGRFAERTATAMRPVGIAYLATLALFVVNGGKHYYLLGLLVPLAAAGTVAIDGWLSRFRTAVPAAVVAVLALVPLPSSLPVTPATTYATSFWSTINDDQLNTIGWPRVVQEIGSAAFSLTREQRSTAIVLTDNYGEAGAWDYYSQGLGRRRGDWQIPAYSGHNGFGLWGPPERTGPVILVSDEPPDPAILRDCRLHSRIDTTVDNEENGVGVYVCAGPNGSWPELWPKLLRLRA